MDIFTRSELVEDGITEDGECNYTTHYFIIAELEDGTRFGHFHTSTDRSEIDLLACKIEGTVAANGIEGLDMMYWNNCDPRYGSEAHSRIGDMHLMSEEEYRHNVNNGYML